MILSQVTLFFGRLFVPLLSDLGKVDMFIDVVTSGEKKEIRYQMPGGEDDIPNPVEIYGKSKLELHFKIG